MFLNNKFTCNVLIMEIITLFEFFMRTQAVIETFVSLSIFEFFKILLALLVACILEKKNDVFVAKATALSESVQMEIMQMLQPMIVNSQDIGNHLSEDFSDILKKTTGLYCPSLFLFVSSVLVLFFFIY